MEQQQKQRPRKRVTRKQLRNRRIGGLIVLLIIIFLISKGCASCIRCACGSGDKDNKTNTEITAVTTTGTTAATVPEVIQPQEYLVGKLPDSHQITVPVIKQKPELPTGSEVTALAMVLNHLGYDVTKEELAKVYLPCADRGSATFTQAFIGSPFEADGLGCFAPVIVDTAQKYILTQGGGKYVKSLNADSFDDVLLRVASNHPVIVWVNQDLELRSEEYCFTVYGDTAITRPAVTTTPVIGGIGTTTAATTTATTTPMLNTSSKQDVYWIPNATCVVLTGYDLDNETVTVIDPAQGEITYDMGMFKTSYNALSKQAVIVY